MKKVRLELIVFALITLLGACSLISGSIQHKPIIEKYITHLLAEEYDTCLNMMIIDKKVYEETSQKLIALRAKLVETVGTNLEYNHLQTQKTKSDKAEFTTPPGTTDTYIEIIGKKAIGTLKFNFNDTNNKIRWFEIIGGIRPIPNEGHRIFGYFFIAIAIGVFTFNIYVIKLVKHSNKTDKWLKYIAIIILNAPFFSYHATLGFSFKLLSTQILGMNFGLGFPSNTFGAFAIPIGAIYWYMRFRAERFNDEDDEAMRPRYARKDTPQTDKRVLTKILGGKKTN